MGPQIPCPPTATQQLNYNVRYNTNGLNTGLEVSFANAGGGTYSATGSYQSNEDVLRGGDHNIGHAEGIRHDYDPYEEMNSPCPPDEVQDHRETLEVGHP